MARSALPYADITAKTTQPLAVSYVQPASVTPIGDATYFIDFGTEHMAGIRLEVPDGIANVSFDLRLAEVICQT